MYTHTHTFLIKIESYCSCWSKSWFIHLRAMWIYLFIMNGSPHLAHFQQLPFNCMSMPELFNQGLTDFTDDSLFLLSFNVSYKLPFKGDKGKTIQGPMWIGLYQGSSLPNVEESQSLWLFCPLLALGAEDMEGSEETSPSHWDPSSPSWSTLDLLLDRSSQVSSTSPMTAYT